MLWGYIKKHMDRHPAQLVETEEFSLTYTALLEQASAFAAGLQQGEKYGILCSCELHTAVALLACFAAGAVAVPLSYRYGEQHYRKIIAGAGIGHLITDREGMLGMEVVQTTANAQPVPPGVALLLCTSGTTGEPKSAMITQQNLMANLQDIDRYFQVDETDAILILRPLYHCAVLTGEFLISLVKGLRVVFASGSFNPVRALQTIRSHQITVLGGTPTLFYHFCNVLKRGVPPLPLKTVMFSGECMTQSVADAVLQCLPDVQKYNVYGLTEASPRVAYLPPELFAQFPLSVGVPLHSLQVQIVDDGGSVLPPNQTGELIVQGPSVMKGYLGHPEETEKTLRGGWLHTGDCAYMDENGYLYIKARMDHMIIRGGMNIYPAEIENAVKQDDRISEAMAYALQDGPVSQRIGLQVVLNQAVSQAELLQVCKQVLPAYQLPDVIDVVEALPRNASGKVVRPGRV